VSQSTSQKEKDTKPNMKTEIKRPGIKHMRSGAETILKVVFRRRRGEFVADMASSCLSTQHIIYITSFASSSSKVILEF
jgi:hypothetical protein